MLDILRITAPIYALIGVGYAVTRWGKMDRRFLDGLGWFVINVAMPALVFSSVAQRSLADLAQPTYVVAYALAAVAALWVGRTYSLRVERTHPTAAAFDAMAVGGANSGYVGYPVLMMVMPGFAGVALGMNVLVESLFVVPLALFWAERGRGRVDSLRVELGHAVRRTLRMPIFVAIMLGLVFAGFGIPVPELLATSLDLLGRTSTGIALFTVGGLLVGLSVRGHVRRILVLSAGKLVLLPALAFGFAAALVALGLPALGPDAAVALVLTGAMPSWTSLAVFAAQYGERQVPPAVLLVTTAASFGTLSALLVLLT